MYMKLELAKSLKEHSLGREIEWSEVARETGIRVQTLYFLKTPISSKRPSTVRIDYIDALCKYFNCTVDKLIAIEPVELPLRDIRKNKPKKDGE